MDTYRAGVWNAACAICGFKFKSDKLRRNWKGFYVCDRDYEPRQPLDFIKSSIDKSNLPWTRPEPEDVTEVDICYMWGSSGYSGLAVAGCMTAGQNSFDAAFLKSLRDGNS